MFKKICCSLLIIFLAIPLLAPWGSKAQGALIPGYEGGIKNDMEYQELFVLTGEPVLLKGSIQINQGRMRDGKRQDRITYKLQSEDKKITLSRNMTFDVHLEQDVNKKQVITVSKLSRFSENISVKSDTNRQDRYTLQNCEINESTITDMTPAVDFYSMNLGGKKVYAINRDEGTVTVELNGNGVGYEHAWGATETRNTTFIINVDRPMTVAGSVYNMNWTGSVDVIQSYNRSRQLTYVENEPTQMSFRGGYLETVDEQAVVSYNYSLPRFDEDGLPKGRNRSDSLEIKLSSVPTQKRTFIPKLLDTSGHWAQTDIEKLASLGIMAPKGQYFGPRAHATRMDFARGVAQLTNIIERAGRLAEVENNLSHRSRQNTAKSDVPVFDDVTTQGQDLEYVKSLHSTGIMQGVGPRRFGPEQTLTRAQAITIIIRALGLEYLAPNPPYSIGFRDDRDIPTWAQDAVYAAKQLGLAQGDTVGYFRPNDPMTKAEAAAFLNRFIVYLQRDIQRDFRDRIVNY